VTNDVIGRTPTAPKAQRRRDFVNYLYSLHDGLTSPNPRQVSESRRVLARLRRSFVGPRQRAEAYDAVFPHDPPRDEEQVWLLAAGLFAINPQPRPREATGRSLGAAMRMLAQRRGESVNRRFVQLVSVDRDALPHYLRQAVQLLGTETLPVNYQQLLDDLVDLLADGSNENDAHAVRLRWVRDFHRTQSSRTPASSESANTTTE
jgi:CRISPR system Cascade subunit CasB